jgi:ribonuclease PH
VTDTPTNAEGTATGPAQSPLRPDGRTANQLRPISFERDFTDMADGSVLVRFGRTHVLCTASIDDEVPRWMRNTGKGWVTAEYNMLPGSSPERIRRRVSGRDQEIQRLIGRSLRAVCDMELLGERSITVDCDVLQADGGTRTASITGGFIALHDAITRLGLARHPLTDHCAAVSVGIVEGECRLDLPYIEDAGAEVDMNIVMNGAGGFIEVQGTAEGAAFAREQLDTLLDLASGGIGELIELQRAVLSVPPANRPPRS